MIWISVLVFVLDAGFAEGVNAETIAWTILSLSLSLFVLLVFSFGRFVWQSSSHHERSGKSDKAIPRSSGLGVQMVRLHQSISDESSQPSMVVLEMKKNETTRSQVLSTSDSVVAAEAERIARPIALSTDSVGAAEAECIL